jgi:clan AA aspartic protease
MIVGEITAENEAVVSLQLSIGTTTVRINAVLDTAFTEYLTLAPDIVSMLSLPRIESTPMLLADGTRVTMDVHETGLLWDGEPRSVPVHVAAGSPLIGMKLLKGSLVTLEVVDGGSVRIEALT